MQDYRYDGGAFYPHTIPWVADTIDFDKQITDAGFRRAASLGGVDDSGASSVHADLYRNEGEKVPEQYLVLLTIGDLVEVILAPHIGELLSLTRDLEPLLTLGLRTQKANDLKEHLVDHSERASTCCIHCERRHPAKLRRD